MGSRAFLMTVDMAAAFFEQCIMREAVKEEERLAILDEMVKAHKAEAFSTSASKEEIVEALAKHFTTWKVSKDAPNKPS